MRTTTSDELCPTCYLPLIDLYRFDARDDAVPVDKGGWSGGGKAWWETNWDYEMSGRGWDHLRACYYQWRLRRVLRKWPRSLYCSQCGYILKRR